MAEGEWQTCGEPQLMLESLPGDVSERKLRLFACACVRRTWHLLSNHQSREAVEVVERYADSQALLRELEQARERAWSVSGDFDRASDEMEGPPDGCFQAESFAAGAVATACRFADGYPYLVHVTGTAFSVGEAAWHAAVGAGRPAEAPAIREAEWLAQADLIREVFGYPFHPVPFRPGWRTADAVGLAQGVYEDRAFDRLPILADALMDAGCEDEQILAHCRSEGPHVRGLE
jgi:hypothetical protein